MSKYLSFVSFRCVSRVTVQDVTADIFAAGVDQGVVDVPAGLVAGVGHGT